MQIFKIDLKTKEITVTSDYRSKSYEQDADIDNPKFLVIETDADQNDVADIIETIEELEEYPFNVIYGLRETGFICNKYYPA